MHRNYAADGYGEELYIKILHIKFVVKLSLNAEENNLKFIEENLKAS